MNQLIQRGRYVAIGMTLVALLVLAACGGGATATPTPMPVSRSTVPVPPHLALITAWIDGEVAPDGTVITAMMEGKRVTTAPVTNGQAGLTIEGVAADTGKTITFKIGQLDAAERDTWEQGGHVDASLTLTAKTP